MFNRFQNSRFGQQVSVTTIQARMIRGTGGTFILRGGNVALKFLTSFVLLRRAIPAKIQSVEPVIDARVDRERAAVRRQPGIGHTRPADRCTDARRARQRRSGSVLLGITAGRAVYQFAAAIGQCGVAPQIVNLYADGKRNQLQRLLTQSARLVLLSIGQVVNVATGSVILLLMMTQHERQAMYGLILTAGSHIVLNLLLVPAWGVESAAVAGAFAVGIGNLAMLWMVLRRLQINPTALGDVRAWKIWKTRS